MERRRFVALAVVVGFLAGGTSTVGAAPGVTAVSEDPPGRGEAVAEGREYWLVHAVDTPDKTTQELIRLPSAPAGLTYVRGAATFEEGTGAVWGVLLRSDGVLVGFGSTGVRLVAGFYGRHPGVRVMDLETWDLEVILEDGLFASLWADRDADLATRVLPTGRERFFEHPSGDGSTGHLRADSPTVGFYDLFPLAGSGKSARPLEAKGEGYVRAVTGRTDLSRGCWTEGSREDPSDSAMWLIREDGRAEAYYPDVPEGTEKPWHEISGWAEAGSDPNDVKDPLERVPPLVRGMRYLGVASLGEVVLYLRSDGTLVYRGGICQLKQLVQPPKPPAGLRYVDVTTGWPSGPIVMMRSDGELVMLDPGTWDHTTKELDWPHGIRSQTAPKGWRFLNPRRFTSRWSDAPSLWLRFYVIEQILPGEKVDSGVTVVKSPKKAVARGKATRLTVEVSSRAILSGGKVLVTTNAGKVLGLATVKGPTKVT
ncbi:MAG: hypothetical protein FWD59_04575, partial [Micrococcales bacterium]|nr:hypothetical protein [Micrococcales bacterium]